MKSLITRKLGMTSTINEDGVVQAITLLSVGDNTVTQIKTSEIDGYRAAQVGFESTKKLAKPQVGHVKAANASPKLYRETRLEDESEDVPAVGTKLLAETFNIGDTVNATGLSKGKGWAGTIKRHNFHRGRKTHGGRSYRRPGSIGSMYPQHILKGKKMAGQMGHEQVTIRNLTVSLVNPELQIIGVNGAVPGPRKSIIVLKGA
jgi:large subunit ribosomal protein L3